MRRTLFDTGGALLLTALVALSGLAHAQHMLCPPGMLANSVEEAAAPMAHHGHSAHQADDAEEGHESSPSHDPGTSHCDACDLCQTAPIATELATVQVDAPTVAHRAERGEPSVAATTRAWDHPPLLAIPPPVVTAAI